MAVKSKRRPSSPNEGATSYFRGVFEQHPEWLKEKSNDAILAQYRADHGLANESPVPEKVKGILANLKSVLRKRSRRRPTTPANRLGRPNGDGARTATPYRPVPSTRTGNKLEPLEEMIDECMTLAKNLGREQLASVIKGLRRCRNEVVWLIGA